MLQTDNGKPDCQVHEQIKSVPARLTSVTGGGANSVSDFFLKKVFFSKILFSKNVFFEFCAFSAGQSWRIWIQIERPNKGKGKGRGAASYEGRLIEIAKCITDSVPEIRNYPRYREEQKPWVISTADVCAFSEANIAQDTVALEGHWPRSWIIRATRTIWMTGPNLFGTLCMGTWIEEIWPPSKRLSKLPAFMLVQFACLFGTFLSIDHLEYYLSTSLFLLPWFVSERACTRKEK